MLFSEAFFARCAWVLLEILAVNFLKKWQQYFKKQLTAEEKELGRKSDKLRKENYKKLRKDGNRIWHGKLQGQLLADVLEADFMEAIG